MGRVLDPPRPQYLCGPINSHDLVFRREAYDYGFQETDGCVILLTICGASISPTIAQQTSTSTSRPQPPAVIKYDGDMASMLAHLTRIYGVTIGLEVDPHTLITLERMK